MEYNFNSKRETIIKEGLTLKKLKNILKNICDEDFNGSNGEDYFIEIDGDNGEKIQKSRFDAEWDAVVFDDTDPCTDGHYIAETILEEAFSYDSNYYLDNIVSVVDTPNSIVITIAYMSCF